jgi:hypothetical protein
MFAALLARGGDMASPDRNSVSVSEDVTFPMLKRLLEFMYTDSLSPPPQADEARARAESWPNFLPSQKWAFRCAGEGLAATRRLLPG